MSPVAAALDILQVEKDCSQGFILPTLFSMKHRLQSIDGGPVLKTFHDTMLKIIDRRFEMYFKFTESNRELLLAMSSNPKFKTDNIESDTNCIVVKNFLVHECIALRSHTVPMSNEIVENVPSNEQHSFFVSFASQRNIRRNSIERDIDEEVVRFLSDSRKEYSILNELLRKNTQY